MAKHYGKNTGTNEKFMSFCRRNFFLDIIRTTSHTFCIRIYWIAWT